MGREMPCNVGRIRLNIDQNYTADPDSVLEITFNTNGTENVEDDEIISITTYTKF